MVKDIAQEPIVELSQWVVVCEDWSLLRKELEGPAYRLVGLQLGTKGRVSSPLIAVDVDGLTADTESGRRYVLRPESERDELALAPVIDWVHQRLGPWRISSLAEVEAALAEQAAERRMGMH